ncbi:MAG: hypothetical protein V1755_07530 [Chloroflexota bacterium]
MQSRTWKTVILCAVSGILCGLMTAAQCGQAESGCQVAPVQSLFSDPAPWSIWLHWVNWLPGVVFALLFAIATAQPVSQAGGRGRIALFAACAGVIYLIAGIVFFLILSVAREDQFAAIIWVWPAGLLAGLAGGILLELTVDRVLREPLTSSGRPRRAWLPPVIGALAGVIFVWICIYGEQTIMLAWPLAFIIWQVPVGLALRRRLA